MTKNTEQYKKEIQVIDPGNPDWNWFAAADALCLK